ncbi:MAG: NAD-dependent epimerase/dehydratase family protein [Flammeovirgaceae bacterium]
MKYFITGATGFVGSYLAKELLEREHTVFASYRKESSFKLWDDIKKKQVSWVEVDILDPLGMLHYTKDVDVVIHCAAFVSLDSKMKKLLHQINVEATANLVNVCLENKVPKFCFISSVAALGKPFDGKYVNENCKWEKSESLTAYSVSKFYAEQEVWRGVAEGLNALIVNPSVVLGVGDWSSSSLKIFEYLSTNPTYYPTGTFNYVDVRDVAEMTIDLIDKNIFGERFILNGGHLSFKDFFEMAAKTLNFKAPTQEMTPFIAKIGIFIDLLVSLLTNKPRRITNDTYKATAREYVFLSNKVRKELGRDFRGLNETLDWIGKNSKKT